VLDIRCLDGTNRWLTAVEGIAQGEEPLQRTHNTSVLKATQRVANARRDERMSTHLNRDT